VATSLQFDDTPAGALDILAGDEAGLWRVRTPNLPISVNGSGDVFAALFFHHWLETYDTAAALSRAASSVYAIVKATLNSGARELSLVAAQDEFTNPPQHFAAEAV
jgi:pyridoxine kinase